MVFERTKDGEPRIRPVNVCARWCEISGVPSLLIFIPAAQEPLGKLSDSQKSQAGAIALEELRRAISSGKP